MMRRREMYSSKSPVVTTAEAFVAPDDFDFDAQEINIVKVFSQFQNENKKAIFLINGTVEISYQQISGASFAYSESGGAFLQTNGDITWTNGSTKRVVILICTDNAIRSIEGTIWAFLSKDVSVFTGFQTPINYIHCEKLDSIIDIPTNSFYGGSLIGKLHISPNCTHIGSGAFLQNANLTGDLYIPDSVTTIETQAFYQCGFTGNIRMSQNIAYIGNQAFLAYAPVGDLYLYPSLTYLGSWAFFVSNINILTFTNPNISIGGAAFYCATVQEIRSFCQVPPTLNDCFNGVWKGCPVHVPAGTLALYQATQYWSDFGNIIDDL